MRTKLPILVLLLAMIITGVNAVPAKAAPYEGYHYSFWGEATPSPIAYLPSKIITGEALGIGNFATPKDMFTASDGTLYILDSGNGRIVILDRDWKLKRVIKGFNHDGKEDSFNNPEGIFVTENNRIFVADTENKRLVELENDGSFVKEIQAPKSDVFRAEFNYFPRKIVLDKANRIYVAARGVFDGIIELDSDGTFNGFMGTNRVRFNPWDYFWKSISTKEQRQKMAQFIPIEFNNVDIDESGFIYTTTADKNSKNPIQKLNPTGIDVLRREGYTSPIGDLRFVFSVGKSVFSDIKVGNDGVYHALDSVRGRIFTYNEDGNLLYITGQFGSQQGTFKNPVAVESMGDNMLVLDHDLGQMTIFRTTRFGKLVNEANQMYSIGKHDDAAQLWQDVLKLNANYEIAYVGIGKALLRQGKYEEAKQYLELGHDRENYSKAFTKFRRAFMRDYFGTIMTAFVGLLTLLIAWRVLRRNRRERVNTDATRIY